MERHVAIIGAGVIGCSIALELRRLGFDVTVVDRNGEAGHGSTSASCGVVRRFYAQPGMVAMAHEGAAIWEDWAGYLGPVDEHLAVFRRPGILYVLPRIDDSVRKRSGSDSRISTSDRTSRPGPSRTPPSSNRAIARSRAPSTRRTRATWYLRASRPATCAQRGSGTACGSS